MGTKKGQRRKTARRAYYKPSRKKVKAKGGRRDKWGDKQIKEGGKLFTYHPTSPWTDERYVGTKAAELRRQGWSVRTRQVAPGFFAIFRRKK